MLHRLAKIELRHFRHALLLAEHGSFARAANAAHLTQPALTKSIQALEAAIGVPVFARTRSGVEPTDVGQIVLRHATALDLRTQELERELERSVGIASEELVLAVGSYQASALVAPAIPRLLSAHPNAKVRVLSVPVSQHSFRAHAREADLIIGEASNIEEERIFEYAALSDHPAVLFARPDHPLTGKNLVDEHDLLPYPIVGPVISASLMERVAVNTTLTMRNALRGGDLMRIQCDSADSARDIVLNSNALGLAHPFLVQSHLATGRARLLACPWPSIAVRYSAAWLSGKRPSALAEEFVQLLQDHARMTSASDHDAIGAVLPHHPGARRRDQ